MIVEDQLVGDVVADEDRVAVRERRIAHQLAHGGALVESDLLDLQDELAVQNLDRARAGFSAQIRVDGRFHGVLQFGRRR